MIALAEAAQFDLLQSKERFQLGLPDPTDVRQWSIDNSICDQSAAAPYDPDRRAPGLMLDQVVANVAVAACADEKSQVVDKGSVYQRGRALMASGKNSEAMRNFEYSIAHGYRAARIDLARLLLQQAPGIDDVRKAISLYERAWSDGVTIAAFDLGNLYEHGAKNAGNEREFWSAPDGTRSWSWYEKAVEKLGTERTRSPCRAESERCFRRAERRKEQFLFARIVQVLRSGFRVGLS